MPKTYSETPIRNSIHRVAKILQTPYNEGALEDPSPHHDEKQVNLL